MSGYKGATFDNDFLKLIFNATAIANLADNAASGPLTQLFVALHTADPTAAGNQTSSEAAYTSYARVAVNRNAGGWTVSGQNVNPTAAITFPAATGGSEMETWASVGVAASGSSKILWAGPISPTINVVTGATPVLGTTSLVNEA